jgi:hypothetical protein
MFQRDLNKLHGNELVSLSLESADDFSNLLQMSLKSSSITYQSSLDSIRLDGNEGSFGVGHCSRSVCEVFFDTSEILKKFLPLVSFLFLLPTKLLPQ